MAPWEEQGGSPDFRTHSAHLSACPFCVDGELQSGRSDQAASVCRFPQRREVAPPSLGRAEGQLAPSIPIYSFPSFWSLFQVYNGSTAAPYTNPSAPVHIITGSAVSFQIGSVKCELIMTSLSIYRILFLGSCLFWS